MPPHYPQQSLSQIPEQSKQSGGFKSLENIRTITEQSYAPSQKTLAMPHTQGLSPGNPVYQSHVTT
jgi:hypothetical protein